MPPLVSLADARPRLPLNHTARLLFADPLNPIVLDLSLNPSPGCGGVTWPAGEVLAAYLVHCCRDQINGRDILELGSGTGLVGLVAGALGGKVWITDQAPLLDIMRTNVFMNKLQASVFVEEFNWGTPLPTSIPRPNLVLAADCVYLESTFPLLVQTLSDLVSDGETEVLFCYKKRRKADKRFFALLKKKIVWVQVMDDPNRASYSRDAISLLRLSKRVIK